MLAFLGLSTCLVVVLSCIASLSEAATVTYSIPSSPPNGAAPLDPAPVGLSIEFFDFPSYFTNVTATHQCLENWENLTGTWPPLRIGGTTQDRAVYDPALTAYVLYAVDSPTDAPANLTYGPSFMTLADTYEGKVVLGLNRGHDNISNTIAAAEVAVSEMGNLLAIELGNEPEYYLSDGQKIATDIGQWTPALDAASQDSWTAQVGAALGKPAIFQGGVFNSAPPTWGISQLLATQNATVQSYIYDYSHHSYPGGTVQSLMSHSNIVSNIAAYDDDIATVLDVGKQYVLGETNSIFGGGAADVSPTFGAALWTLDYSLRASASNISRTYFHHGTLGLCYYCFFGRYDMGAPYYGAYAAVAAMASGSHIAMLDTGTTDYGAYVVYGANGAPLRAILINSVYFETGTRGSETFTLTGLTGATVRWKTLTAANALSRVDQGSNPSFGGQEFANVTCAVQGTETYESASVSGGQVQITVLDSEAVVVYF